MLSLAQSSRLKSGAGAKLPDVWRGFRQHGVQLRRGQLSLWAAAPGVGKSALALAYAVGAGVPTLFFSMDTDAYTMRVRAAQMQTGWTQEVVEAEMEDPEFQQRVFSTLRHIDFEYRSGLTTDEVAGVTAAYGERWGAFPHLTILDNIGNLAFEGDEFGELRRMTGDLHRMARHTSAHIMVLHHVTGQYEDGTVQPPLSGLQGKISKYPELIMTGARGAREGQVFWALVKARSGKADPSGTWRVELSADMSTMQVRDREYVVAH